MAASRKQVFHNTNLRTKDMIESISNIDQSGFTYTDDIPAGLENYSAVLDYYGLAYKEDGYYFLVGEVNITQGWILDITVIASQAIDLFKAVIPILVDNNLAFRIPMDLELL